MTPFRLLGPDEGESLIFSLQRALSWVRLGTRTTTFLCVQRHYDVEGTGAAALVKLFRRRTQSRTT